VDEWVRLVEEQKWMPGLGGGFQFCRLSAEPLFDADGQIRSDVSFAQLAEFVWFAETGTGFPHPSPNAVETRNPAQEQFDVDWNERQRIPANGLEGWNSLRSFQPSEGDEAVPGNHPLRNSAHGSTQEPAAHGRTFFPSPTGRRWPEGPGEGEKLSPLLGVHEGRAI
jgi:hypothetical protein